MKYLLSHDALGEICARCISVGVDAANRTHKSIPCKKCNAERNVTATLSDAAMAVLIQRCVDALRVEMAKVAADQAKPRLVTPDGHEVVN